MGDLLKGKVFQKNEFMDCLDHQLSYIMSLNGCAYSCLFFDSWNFWFDLQSCPYNFSVSSGVTRENRFQLMKSIFNIDIEVLQISTPKELKCYLNDMQDRANPIIASVSQQLSLYMGYHVASNEVEHAILLHTYDKITDQYICSDVQYGKVKIPVASSVFYEYFRGVVIALHFRKLSELSTAHEPAFFNARNCQRGEMFEDIRRFSRHMQYLHNIEFAKGAEIFINQLSYALNNIVKSRKEFAFYLESHVSNPKISSASIQMEEIAKEWQTMRHILIKGKFTSKEKESFLKLSVLASQIADQEEAVAIQLSLLASK